MGRIVEQQIDTVSKTGKGAKIGNEWYNSKFPVFSDVAKGSVVSFEYDVGSNGGNFVKGKIEVNTKATPQKGAAGTTSYEAGMAVGMAVNNAVQICIANNKADDLTVVRETAIGIFKLAQQLKEDVVNGSIQGNTKEVVTQQEESTDESDHPF